MKAIKYLFLFLFSIRLITAQTIVVDSTASIYVEQDADVCAGEVGNISGNFYGEGTECGQSLVSAFQLSVNVSNGWNMVSVPGLNSPDQNVNTWWQYRDQGANVFRYAGGYQSVTDAVPGTGYWMKHAGARTYNTGDEWPAGGIQIISHTPLTGVSGWNLIGGYELSVSSANVTTNPPGLQSGPIYKYSSGYQIATTIDPGYGYWIKLTGAGQIIIPETMAKDGKPAEYIGEDWGKIILTDATGVNYTLYAVTEETDLSQYELPPAPPSGMFDIRFGSGRMAEDINNSTQTIEMNGVTYPLTVKVEGMDIRLMDESGKAVNVNLKSGENVRIENSGIMKLMVSGESMPSKYSLEQNYPNPFNPSTTIRFSLPEAAQIKINLYNMLGEQVATIAEGMYESGYHKVTFNASSLPSGSYVYRLESSEFIQVKKMLLLK
ncbi:MAG: T9SS type A sorting domain-containing protein [Ignavibacteriaceae bacterium]|nr:T9SS type A sorting domain-containing protein [Ignavibacteriaceae bacterium]